MQPFNAIICNKTESAYTATIETVGEDALVSTGDHDVLVKVEYSTINFKDGLAITGRSPILRKFPMSPGIDFCGTVETSDHSLFKSGDAVVLTGWGVGETHPGGLAQYAKVKGDWLVAKPASMTLKQSMAIGTAGYTAMLCVLAIENHGVKPGDGEVLVTGAAGGVGSIAVAVMAKLGYRVVTSTGRLSESDYLKSLGASDIMDRNELSSPGKPLGKERWAAVIDTVGSHTLANACATTRWDGAVAACGLAQGMDFPATVAPFILRGVTLYGINSVTTPRAKREMVWQRLAKDLPMDKLDAMTQEITLTRTLTIAPEILAGQVRGRLVVNVNQL
ncbi:MAG: oxidoreductase [Betaproteobacteria bacterium]|nr:oxidoreductase [Betaproteobacteria bacterium]